MSEQQDPSIPKSTTPEAHTDPAHPPRAKKADSEGTRIAPFPKVAALSPLSSSPARWTELHGQNPPAVQIARERREADHAISEAVRTGLRREMVRLVLGADPGSTEEPEMTVTAWRKTTPLTVERLIEDMTYLKSLRFPVRVWIIDCPQYVDQIRKAVRADEATLRHAPLLPFPLMQVEKRHAHASFTPPVGWRTGVWVEFSDDTFEPIKGTLPPDEEAAFLHDYPDGRLPWQEHKDG